MHAIAPKDDSLSDRDRTTGLTKAQVLEAKLEALTVEVRKGFESLSEQRQEARAEAAELRHEVRRNTEAIGALKEYDAKVEASNFDQRLTALSKRVRENERFRWRLLGIGAALGALMGGGVAALLKMLGG